jgi:YggT family protein
MNFLITAINTLISALILATFIYVLLGYFLPPSHPIRRVLGQVIEPLLQPIRKLIPPLGGFDLSPLILMIVLQILGFILVSILRRLI